MGAQANLAIGAVEGWVRNGNAAPYAYPGVYNRTPVNLQKWRKAVGDVISGAATTAKYMIIGDSQVAGSTRLTAWPRRLKDILTTSAIPFTDDSSFGPAGRADLATFATYDPRHTFGAGWALYPDTTYSSLGGVVIYNSTTTNGWAWTPLGTVDTVEVYYINAPAAGSFTVDIDGAVSGSGFATVTTNGNTQVAKSTINVGSAGAHTLNIKRVSGLVMIVGMRAYNSAVPSLTIMTAGWAGSSTGNWATNTNPYQPIGALKLVAPHLTDIMLGANDWHDATATPLATFITNYQTIITAAKVSGDVRLITPYPSDPVSWSTLQAQYNAAIMQLGATNSVEVVNLTDRYVSYTQATAIGFSAGDGVHQSATGHADLARAAAVGLLL